MVKRTLLLSALVAVFCSAPAFAACEAIEIQTVEQFKKLFNSNKPVFTMYSRQRGCPPCNSTKPKFKALAKETPDVTFAIIYTDKQGNPFRALTSNISGVPTFKLSYKGQVHKTAVGGRSKPELKQLLDQFRGMIKSK